MKTYLLPLFGSLLGGMAAFWLFAMLFNTPVTKLFPQTLLPLGLAAAASFILSRMAPQKWKVLAFSVALPTMLLAALLFIALWMEDRSDWHWVLVAAATLSICMVSGWFARGKSERI